MSELQKYKVLRPVDHDHRRYETGSTIELSPADAVKLLRLNQPAIEVVEDVAGPVSKPTAPPVVPEPDAAVVPPASPAVPEPDAAPAKKVSKPAEKAKK